MLDFDAVIENLKKELNCDKDVELATQLGVNASTLYAWKNRKQIPYKEICLIAVAENLSVDKILGIENETQSFSPILEDYQFALGSMSATKNFLEEKLLEIVLEKFKNNNLGSYETIGRIFSFINGASEGFRSRPLLFLYYVLHNIPTTTSKAQNPKKILIDAIEKTHFSRATFGLEFLPNSVQKIVQYVEHVMPEEEAKLLVENTPRTLHVLENLMPLEMLLRHQKKLKKKAHHSLLVHSISLLFLSLKSTCITRQARVLF
jgi:hypothetical protein